MWCLMSLVHCGWRVGQVGVYLGVYREQIIWGQNVVSMEDYAEFRFHSGPSGEL